MLADLVEVVIGRAAANRQARPAASSACAAAISERNPVGAVFLREGRKEGKRQ